MNRAIKIYVSIVVATGVLILVATFDPSIFKGRQGLDLVAWTIICFFAETLWMHTVTGQASSTMISTMVYAMVFGVGHIPAMWAAGLGYALGNSIVYRMPPVKSIFNFSHKGPIRVFVAGLAFQGMGGTFAPSPGMIFRPSFLLAAVVSAAVYQVSGILLVSGAVSLAERRKFWQTCKVNFASRDDLITALALFFLSPLVLLSYSAVGYKGIVLFFIPLFLIKEASRRYVELERAQEALVASERMAAKGEMAAEIGHELSNYLAAVKGRAQLLVMSMDEETDKQHREGARVIFEQAANMAILTKGLMDFSYRELRKTPTDLADLIRKTIDFIRPQNKYDSVQFDLDLDPRVPELTVDPGQIGQVILNLCSNAADAMNENDTENKRISISMRLGKNGKTVEVRVRDTGPGVPGDVGDRIFEPTFSTKKEGHGFGLSTCFRIMHSHGGKITLADPELPGATFLLTLPTRS